MFVRYLKMKGLGRGGIIIHTDTYNTLSFVFFVWFADAGKFKKTIYFDIPQVFVFTLFLKENFKKSGFLHCSYDHPF